MKGRAWATLRGALGNAAAVAGFRLAADVALLGFIVLLSRRFGAEGVGLYAYAMAVAALIFSIPQAGLASLLVAQGSVSTAAFGGLWRPVAWLSRSCAVLGAVLLSVVVLLGPADARPVLLIVGLANLLYHAGELHRAAFAARERSGQVAWAEIVYKGAILLFGVPALLAGWSLPAVLLSMPLAGAAYLAAVAKAARPLVAEATRAVPAAPSSRLQTLKRAAPFLLTVTIAAPIYRLHPIVLTAFAGAAASGYYAASYKSVEAGLLAFGALGTALMPALVRLGMADRAQHDAVFRRACLAAFALGGTGAIGGIVLAPWLLPTVFGAGFEAAVSAFRVLCLLLPITGLRNVFLAGLTASGRLRRWTAAQTASLAASAGAALLLVPPFGLMGAAVGLLVAETLALAVAALLHYQGRPATALPSGVGSLPSSGSSGAA